MTVYAVMFDGSAAAGSKLDPGVRAEVDFLAPSTIDDGDIDEPMFADGAVSTRALADEAVTTDKLDDLSVTSGKLAAGAVTTAKLDDEAVTADKAGTGVVTAVDHSGTPISSTDMYLTAAQYAAIGTPDPNTTYYLVG